MSQSNQVTGEWTVTTQDDHGYDRGKSTLPRRRREGRDWVCSGRASEQEAAIRKINNIIMRRWKLAKPIVAIISQ